MSGTKPPVPVLSPDPHLTISEAVAALQQQVRDGAKTDQAKLVANIARLGRLLEDMQTIHRHLPSDHTRAVLAELRAEQETNVTSLGWWLLSQIPNWASGVDLKTTPLDPPRA